MRAPALHIPALDLSGPQSIDGYISSSKHEQSVSSIAPTQSRSDSGLEAIISSHIQPSSTFDTNPTITDLHQPTSISSGLGSEIMDSMTTQGYKLTAPEQEKLTREPKRENSVLRHDFARKITINDDSRSKLIFRQNELKACLETEISRSMDEFDAKKDQKTLSRIITHAVDLIKDKKVSTYPELKQKLLAEHKNDAAIVDPVVRALYCTMEKQGLDNVDKPEFPLAIRDVSQRTMIYGSVTIFSFIHSFVQMVRLPAKQTLDTVQQLDKTTKAYVVTGLRIGTFFFVFQGNHHSFSIAARTFDTSVLFDVWPLQVERKGIDNCQANQRKYWFT